MDDGYGVRNSERKGKEKRSELKIRTATSSKTKQKEEGNHYSHTTGGIIHITFLNQCSNLCSEAEIPEITILFTNLLTFKRKI